MISVSLSPPLCCLGEDEEGWPGAFWGPLGIIRVPCTVKIREANAAPSVQLTPTSVHTSSGRLRPHFRQNSESSLYMLPQTQRACQDLKVGLALLLTESSGLPLRAALPAEYRVIHVHIATFLAGVLRGVEGLGSLVRFHTVNSAGIRVGLVR